jgi:hypothetical protein
MSDVVDADLMIGLRKLASADDKANEFSFERDGMRITVDYVGGSSSRLTLTSAFDAVARPTSKESGYRKSAQGRVLRGVRPMLVTLREEEPDDRAAKAEGLSREHQTGDEAFDRAVYVDSPTTDEELLDAVLCEGVRAGSLELVKLGFGPIVIDDAKALVVARLDRFWPSLAEEGAAERVVAAFTKVLANLPPVERAVGQHAPRSAAPKVLAVMGAICFLVGAPIALISIADAYHCSQGTFDGDGMTLKDGCGGPAVLAVLAGLGCGLVGMIIARNLARRSVAGHSDSHTQLRYVGIAAFAWTALAAFVTAAMLAFSAKV